MSDQKTYAAVVGFVQFDVDENKTTSGKSVRNVTVRNAGSQKLVRIALWAENWAHVPKINRSDAVWAEGSSSSTQGTKNGEPVTYHNLNAFLFRLEGVTYRPTQNGQKPVNATSGTASADDAPF